MKTFLLTLLFLLLGATAAYAAVPELGNCRDNDECHLYCEIPSNKPACWAYAQTKVLGDSTPSATLVFPIVELGNCADKIACKAYCDQQINHDACVDYARTHNLGKLPAEAALVAKAKAELGCDSLKSCKAICENAANKDKCKAFTLKFAPPAIQERVIASRTILDALQKALGCTTKDSCVQMCQLPANKSVCNTVLRPASGSAEMQERQKLGADCKTTDECRTWCQTHPLLCPVIKPETHATGSGEKRPPIGVNPHPESASHSSVILHSPPTTNPL